MKIVQRSWISHVGIVVIAAIVVEIISIIQYRHIRRIMEDEMNVGTSAVQSAVVAEISHILDLTEATMNENLWVIRRYLHNPDSVFSALVYLIDDNPHVVGGFMSFVPDYYPSRGRLFEPYASKKDGVITLEQIAGQDHDYTQNPFYNRVIQSGKPDWSDPYQYGQDSLYNLCTYSYPVFDDKGKLAAVCGVDMDLSWLGDTLNARQPSPSSFVLMLTQDGTLVASPPSSRTSAREVENALSIFRDGLLQSADKKVSLRVTQMDKDPFWQVVQVYRTDELYGRMRRVRSQLVLPVILCLLILFFIIHRFVVNEKKLWEASAEQARISGELTVARNIQQEMLPKAFPKGIFGMLEPALEVGGDLFDFYRRDGKLFFCIGDVSGKGVPSAMLMSVIHSLFRMVSQREESPSRILMALNEQLCKGNDSNMFVTFFVGCLDYYTGKLRFSNAGHDKPFFISDTVRLLPVKSNLPLGVFPDTEFEEQFCTLSPGDALFLYTDGLTEAKNRSRECFGRSRVQDILSSSIGDEQMTSGKTVEALSAAAHRFAEGAPQSDDLTMLLIEYEPGELFRDRLVLTNDKAEISRLGCFVLDFCKQLELDRKVAYGLRLALEETVVNVISYAYPSSETGEISIYADSDRQEVRFTVVDSGVPFDPTAVLSADTTLDAQNRPIGGLGIHLTRKLMDSVSYCRKNSQNVLTLTKSVI